MTSYSQSGQDVFVEVITNKKQNGYFLEIGGNHPISHNNTYLLENNYNWKGLIVEYDSSFENLYKIHRKNSIYEINDARNVDYKDIFLKNNFPLNMDYLQIDLDVDNKSTLDTLILLDNTILDKYKFATVTFEHDIYRGDYFETQKISRQIFTKLGYLLVFPNVRVCFNGQDIPYEDWWVHPDLVDMNLINKISTTKSLHSDEIKKLLLEDIC